MNWLSTVMTIASAFLQVYMLLLVIRIVLTWVSMDHGHPAIRILHAVCDPYLNWFRRFRFLTLGNVDFSPLAALIVLNFLQILASSVGMEGQLTVGIGLAILLKLVWGAAAFLFLLLGVLAVVRFLAIQFRWGGQALWSYLDSLLQPPAYALGRVFRPGTFLAYTTTLLVLGVTNLAAWVAGNILVGILTKVLLSLPI